MLDSETPVLRVENLSASYGDINVLFDVSLNVWSGKVTTVLGANGAGKTTLLSTIAGLLRAQAGTMTLDGTDLRRMRPYARVSHGLALVQEGKRVFHRRTVHENLLLGGYRLPRRARPKAVTSAYQRFPILFEKRNKPAGSLSGGQQQMLAIAQALVSGPRVLMLDEPSAGLAPIIVDESLATIRQLKAEGMAVVLVEQLVDKALRVADHVVVLQRGRAVIDRPADRVAEADLLDAYLGVSGTSASAPTAPPQEPESRGRHNSDSIPLRHI